MAMTLPKTKLPIPLMRRDLVQHPRLIERLNAAPPTRGGFPHTRDAFSRTRAGFARALTLKSVPGGSGKTMLVKVVRPSAD